MHRITHNEAAMIQRRLIGVAMQVAQCEHGIARLNQLAGEYPELRPLARTVSELRYHAQPMLLYDVPAVAA